SKPDLKIDLTQFSSALPANHPATKEWVAKSGKVAEVEGTMGGIDLNPKTGYETFIVRPETRTGTAIGCELLSLPDWREVCPGRRIRVVGVIDIHDYGTRGMDIRLKDATVVAASGEKVPAFNAEQIGKEHAADPKGFSKKWPSEEKFVYVTGKL